MGSQPFANGAGAVLDYGQTEYRCFVGQQIIKKTKRNKGEQYGAFYLFKQPF